jgi:hypothetical protein
LSTTLQEGDYPSCKLLGGLMFEVGRLLTGIQRSSVVSKVALTIGQEIVLPSLALREFEVCDFVELVFQRRICRKDSRSCTVGHNDPGNLFGSRLVFERHLFSFKKVRVH